MAYSFDLEHAKKYGVDEAIFLNNAIFWISKNKADGVNLHDGRTWTFNSAEKYTEVFPFWTAKQIRRISESLIKQGVLIKGNYNKMGGDRTSWFALSDESILPNGQMQIAKQSRRFDQTVTPIPDIKQDIIHISDSHESDQHTCKPKKSPKHKVEESPEYIALRDKTKEQFKKGFLALTKSELVFDASENTNLKRLTKEFLGKPETLYKIMKHLYSSKMKKDKEYAFNAFTPSGLYSARKRILSNMGGLTPEEMSDLSYGTNAQKKAVLDKVNAI